MDDEKFVLNKSNIIVLVIDAILFILVLVSIILLVNSFKEESGLPELEVTKERTSTSFSRTTTEETTTTTTTTAKRDLVSPYYDVNVDNILNDELLTKNNITNEEALSVANMLYEVASKILNISDNSLLDIKTTIEYAKEGEIDSLINNDIHYGIIYNGESLLKKVFTEYYVLNINNLKINGTKAFINNNGTYYRMENKLSNVDIITNSFILSKDYNYKYDNKNIYASMNYYKTNYKEEGYSSPVYKTMNMRLLYEYGRWRINEINFPLMD